MSALVAQTIVAEDVKAGDKMTGLGVVQRASPVAAVDGKIRLTFVNGSVLYAYPGLLMQVEREAKPRVTELTVTYTWETGTAATPATAREIIAIERHVLGRLQSPGLFPGQWNVIDIKPSAGRAQ